MGISVFVYGLRLGRHGIGLGVRRKLNTPREMDRSDSHPPQFCAHSDDHGGKQHSLGLAPFKDTPCGFTRLWRDPLALKVKDHKMRVVLTGSRTTAPFQERKDDHPGFDFRSLRAVSVVDSFDSARLALMSGTFSTDFTPRHRRHVARVPRYDRAS